jgi:hypothetical protein
LLSVSSWTDVSDAVLGAVSGAVSGVVSGAGFDAALEVASWKVEVEGGPLCLQVHIPPISSVA